jgi:DNA-binding SARP family transcriptional activator
MLEWAAERRLKRRPPSQGANPPAQAEPYTMPGSRLLTLGSFGFSVEGASSSGPSTRKARALMAFLILHRDADAPRERLLNVFWPDAEPDHARDSLNTALYSIRRCVKTSGMQIEDCLLATKSTVRWMAETEVDAERFARLAARREAGADTEAIELYRGEFLEGDYDNWAVTERERLAALYETVLARVVRTSKDTDAAQRLISRNPYDEAPYATLIEADLAAGRRSAAAAWVERCRAALSEVGEKPSADFESRYGSVTQVQPLVAAELTLPFAGRDAESATVAVRFVDAAKGLGSLTLVQGDAGIGKSTLLQRAARLGTEHGISSIFIRCAAEVPTSFGPWPRVFEEVGAADFDGFVRAHTSDATTAVAREIAGRIPERTAIVVDDAHELNVEAFDVLVELVKGVRTRRAVIVSTRPEGVARLRASFVASPFEELALSGLDKNSLEWALTQALGGEQPQVLDLLFERTRGHPLFFAGLLNSLVTSGALARREHRWSLIEPLDPEVQLPDSVRRFIETRLAARGDAPRAVASALALEPAANSGDLVAVLRMPETAVLDALDDLLALGLIMQPLAGSQFAFSHDLVREVAAATLNAARRAALHRGFARRLAASGKVEIATRLARHFEGAGDSLSAAEAYLRAAGEALAVNAARDAMDRCAAGVREAETLEPTVTRDALLTKLHRAAARAAIAAGNPHDAVARAREAVAFTRDGDQRDSARALLDLAVMEGAAAQTDVQRSDAAEAVRLAKACADDELEGQALIEEARAARESGQLDAAIRLCTAVREIALKLGRQDLAEMALEELLRAQLAAWHLNDAVETAKSGLDLAHRLGPLTEAEFRAARACLWYVLERNDEARADLDVALRLSDDPASRRRGFTDAPLHPVPALQFECHYMTAKIAVARQAWNEVELAARAAEALTNVAKLPRRRLAITLLRIDSLLARQPPDDDDDLLWRADSSLSETAPSYGLLGWSDCVELALSRVAARRKSPAASGRLRRALNVLEERAHHALLDVDWAFSRLADAADESGNEAIASHARARAKHYRAARIAAAGTMWGGESGSHYRVLSD